MAHSYAPRMERSLVCVVIRDIDIRTGDGLLSNIHSSLIHTVLMVPTKENYVYEWI